MIFKYQRGFDKHKAKDHDGPYFLDHRCQRLYQQGLENLPTARTVDNLAIVPDPWNAARGGADWLTDSWAHITSMHESCVDALVGLLPLTFGADGGLDLSAVDTYMEERRMEVEEEEEEALEIEWCSSSSTYTPIAFSPFSDPLSSPLTPASSIWSDPADSPRAASPVVKVESPATPVARSPSPAVDRLSFSPEPHPAPVHSPAFAPTAPSVSPESESLALGAHQHSPPMTPTFPAPSPTLGSELSLEITALLDDPEFAAIVDLQWAPQEEASEWPLFGYDARASSPGAIDALPSSFEEAPAQSEDTTWFTDLSSLH